ncbi:MAG: efflux RND transporter permease subunit, partial [Myxococcota bacterium]|nr:efflux RND transporter permease subunit [Myxococcota bacterium]
MSAGVSEPFIRRPVATTLLMLGLLLVGVAAFTELPVSALPQVDYPTIVVSTSLPGGSADTMASAVTTPLERQFGQIPSLTQMTSVSSFGYSQITLQFDLDRSIDGAQQDVQAAINAATSLLPSQLPTPPTYSKSNPADQPILAIAISSDVLPLDQVDDFADSILAQKISQVTGVGLVTINGGQKPAVRIQVDPETLAGTGLTLEDVRSVLIAANVNQPKGNIDGTRQDYALATNDQLFKASGFKPLVLAYANGSPVRLADVADVVDGVENTQLAGWANDKRAIILNVQRQPGANVIQVADRVKALLGELQASLPQGIDVKILSDRTETVRASVQEVERTLVVTIGLVIAVIFVFLRNLRGALIPSVAVPLSLIGTFGVMYLLGYSLNNLSLMALTIATGFVVDDAIVMVENIARYIEAGERPFDAALKGAAQIGFTIVSLTVSLVAVLIPLLFMGGLIGRLFREFAVTLAASIGVSAVLSLTLTPMMCAHLLRPPNEHDRGAIHRWSERAFSSVIASYDRALRFVLRHKLATLIVTIATLGLTVVLAIAVPKGFFPQQDTGVILGVSQAAPDVSFSKMM